MRSGGVFSLNRWFICLSACTHGNTLGIQELFSFLRDKSSLVSCDMIRTILKMGPKMALIDPSPLSVLRFDLYLPFTIF